MPRQSLFASVFAVALAVALSPPVSAEDHAQPTVLVETADGSVLVGTLPAEMVVTLVQAEGETTVAVRDVLRLAISKMRQEETRALEAEVLKFRERLASKDHATRTAASDALKAMPGAIAPFVSRLLKDTDAEVVMRAQEVLEILKRKGQLLDSRDLVVLEKKVLRGWLKLEKIQLSTALGDIEIARAEIRTLRAAVGPVENLPSDPEELWLPPMALLQPPVPALPVTVFLRNGSVLVGLTSAESLALVNEDGKSIPANHLVSLFRMPDDPGHFQARCQGVNAFRAALAAKEIAVVTLARRWSIPAEMIESIKIGPPRPILQGGDAMTQLVEMWLQADAQGVESPSQRFWVSINDQPANPWDSADKKGMTWRLLQVHDQVALLGADEATDAYQGDTTVELELPILCVRKRDLTAPEGVDPKDFYLGWSGGEVRLTKPVAGQSLTSLEVANSIIKGELGEGWEMAEHHSPNGGWHWWAYWGDVPEEEGK